MKKTILTSALLFIISFCYSQKFNNTPEKYSLELTNGISTPTGDFNNFADTGFNSGIILNKYFCENVAIGFSTNYSSLAVKQELGISNKNWNSLSIHAGPQYQLNINRLNIQLYGRLGVSFIKAPEITSFYPNSEVIVTSLEQANTSALNTRVGINLGLKICKGLEFYVASEYASNIKGEINYRTRDLSSAVILNETIDPEAADAIVFSPKNISFSTLNTNFGIRLDIEGNRSTRATDHNSSRSNKTSHTPATVNSGNGDGGGKGKATDHNSSRSNKTSHTPASGNVGGDGDGDGDGKGKATDHNSSRSNKTSNNPIKIDDGDNDGDESGKGKATDHNSSRSNKTSNNPIKIDDGDNDGDESGKGKATDHNSSRSNKTSHTPASGNVGGDGDGDGDGKGKATDHNSSRSNKTSSSKEIDDPIVSITQEGVVEIGTLLRILLDARKFEFKKNNGHLIIGNIDSTISVNKLADFNRRYLNKPSKVVLIVKKTLFKSGRAQVNYELLDIVDK